MHRIRRTTMFTVIIYAASGGSRLRDLLIEPEGIYAFELLCCVVVHPSSCVRWKVVDCHYNYLLTRFVVQALECRRATVLFEIAWIVGSLSAQSDNGGKLGYPRCRIKHLAYNDCNRQCLGLMLMDTQTRSQPEPGLFTRQTASRPAKLCCSTLLWSRGKNNKNTTDDWWPSKRG